jgi:hypothetical protein
MVSGPATLKIEVAKLDGSIVQAVKNMAVVKDVSASGNLLNINLKTSDDVRAEVSRAVTMAGGVIVSMASKGHSLEDVFIQLIDSHKGVKQQ